MDLIRRFPIGLNYRTFIAFFIAVHLLIFANVFWEIFEWFNHRWIDPNFTDPIVFAWVFWFCESLIAMYILGKKIPPSTLS